MSITLAQARTRVRFLVDDLSGTVADDTQTDAALASAQQEAFHLAVNYNPNMFSQDLAWSSNSSGVITFSTAMPPYIPMRIVSVAVLDGTRRYIVPPSRTNDVSEFASVTETGRMTYVPSVSFPSGSGVQFYWGDSTINIPPLDEYMCALAATQIKINDGELNTALESRLNRLQRTVEKFVNPSSITAMPMDDTGNARRSKYVWVRTSSTTIQLAYP
jgi:hypothetical protein